MPKAIDLLGQRFGLWTVIALSPERRCNHRVWICRCDCGTERGIQRTSLSSGASRSCGCQRDIDARARRFKHGESQTRLCQTWHNMRRRCSNPKSKDAKWYYHRGIRVCEEWQTFEAFRDWALANGYRDDLTIDRIDNTKDYEPTNCKWSTMSEQALNRRSKWHTGEEAHAV